MHTIALLTVRVTALIIAFAPAALFARVADSQTSDALIQGRLRVPPIRPVPVLPPAQRPVLPLLQVKPLGPSDFEREQQMSAAELMNRWNRDILKASRRFGVPVSWLRAVMRTESGGRTMASETQKLTSSMGAVGLMQLMPETYREWSAQLRLGPDPADPHDNIVAAAAYLRFLFGKYGYPAMFAAYQGGPGNLEQWLADGNVLPSGTQRYLASITGAGLVVGGGPKSFVSFTQADGELVRINAYAVMTVRAPLPNEQTTGVQAVINLGQQEQGVRESLDQVKASLRRHGAGLIGSSG